MVDVVDKETRSRMMSGIRGKNTQPELQVRKALHAEGLRFRLNCRDLPGKPDMVLPKYKTIVFVHGCFWHGHRCRLFKAPSTRAEFWKNKIESNIRRDVEVRNMLASMGWRVVVVWECLLKGKADAEVRRLVHPVAEWIRSKTDGSVMEVAGDEG
jgi:DNA mismatch endonuclease (patch repair protein)